MTLSFGWCARAGSYQLKRAIVKHSEICKQVDSVKLAKVGVFIHAPPHTQIGKCYQVDISPPPPKAGLPEQLRFSSLLY